MDAQGLRPATPGDIADAIADATRQGHRLEIRGGGSKARIGAPTNAAVLHMGGFAGVIDYDPAELVLTVGAGTPLAEVEALVASEGQMLAFEPFDHGPIFGDTAGATTLGGVVAAGVSGSRRVAMGAVRDHLLGFQAVSGRGETLMGGAKVVKNVTGYDLPKLVCGSWGRLAALTQVTLKVMPRGRTETTLALRGLGDAQAQAAMTLALRAPAEVASAAHLPAAANGGAALTVLKLIGFEPSVRARSARLGDLLGDFGQLETLAPEEAEAVWQAVRRVAPFGEAPVLWRISVPPSAGAALGLRLAEHGGRWLLDWGGALLWLALDGDAALVREAAAAAGGHATLVRAPAQLRATVPVLHPPSPGVAALSERVRRAFDPHGVFETGRFLDRLNAH